MAHKLTESQQKWFDLAAMHADDFATRAAEHDADGSYPFENIEAVKASGYVHMAIPTELGGGGADLLDMCIGQERLARGDGATALAINMALASWFYTDMYNTGNEQVAPFLEHLAKDQLLVCANFSDPAADASKGVAGLAFTAVKAEKADGGFRISGRHAFGTNILVSDYYRSAAVYSDPDEGEVALVYTIPMDTPGIELQNDWNTMCMRCTGSHSVVMDNVFVPDDVVVRHPTSEWGQDERRLFAFNGATFSTVYIGIARAARDFAINYTKDRTRLPFNHPESYYPGNQFLAAEMDIGLKAAWAWQLDIADRLTDPYARDDETIIDALAMQYFCMKTAVDVVNKAFEIVGGAALAKRLPLERYYRDVRAGPIHPLGGYGALELIGKHAYGLHRDVKPRYV